MAHDERIFKVRSSVDHDAQALVVYSVFGDRQACGSVWRLVADPDAPIFFYGQVIVV